MRRKEKGVERENTLKMRALLSESQAKPPLKLRTQSTTKMLATSARTWATYVRGRAGTPNAIFFFFFFDTVWNCNHYKRLLLASPIVLTFQIFFLIRSILATCPQIIPHFCDTLYLRYIRLISKLTYFSKNIKVKLIGLKLQN